MGNKLPTLLFVLLVFPPAHAHDASTYGGLFRSRDNGQSWFSIDTGVFIGGALGVAVHPSDANHLLMTTDAGMLRSRNGGRDWLREASQQFAGPVFAAAFSADGRSAWAVTTEHVLWSDESGHWRTAEAPSDALPAQVIAAASASGRAYLVGMESFFASEDGGKNWTRAAAGLPDGEIAAFSMARQPKEVLYLVVNSTLWTSDDGARSWRSYGQGLPAGRLDMLYVDARQPQRMHALAQGRLYASEDAGATWQAKGKPLPETHLVVRGLAAAADGNIIMTTTHKGLYRSVDGGDTWMLVESNLPIHLESGPLAADPHDASTFYAGYALMPYGETWRRAVEARAPRAQLLGRRTRWLALAGLIALIALTAAAWWFSARRAREQARAQAADAGGSKR